MKPDRSNYEIWFIDWLDGRLDGQGMRDLEDFLDANPDLRDEFNSLAGSRLTPGNDHFPGKADLYRNVQDIDRSQIEYLSVAALENDLTAEQRSELELNLENDPENRRLFESIRKIKLIPPDIKYPAKSKLKRLTIAGRMLRYSPLIAGAAATIAILLVLRPYLPGHVRRIEPGNSISSAPDTFIKEIIIERPGRIYVVPDRNNQKTAANLKVTALPIIKVPEVVAQAQINATDTLNRLKQLISRPALVPDPEPVYLLASEQYHSLIASNNTFTVPPPDDERSSLNKFIARTFREKILREKKPVDTPLRSYEIAEAGIEGLNKLFGWNMALVTTNDKSGEVRSVYFSSKLIKFNAPVRKNEILQ